MTSECNLGSQCHLSRSYKWLASEWRHYGWTSYGTLTDGSCSTLVHLGWLEHRAGRTLCLGTHHCFARSETGSESMRHQALNQSRSRRGMMCSVGPQCCRFHWFSLVWRSWRLCMIEEVAQLDSCAPCILADKCIGIFCCWRHTLHDKCHHVDRGRSHNTCSDRWIEDRTDEKHPEKSRCEHKRITYQVNKLFT